MGDAADDVYASLEFEMTARATLLRICPLKSSKTKKCRWEVNDDSLYECRTCGKVTDL
jgi:hypothetical protein